MDRYTHLVCSVSSEVIKVMQLVEVANCESGTGTQGCDGAVPAAPARAMCHMQKLNLAVWPRVAFDWDTELEFWGCEVNSHLIMGSCAALAKAFSLAALFFQLSNEGGSSLARVYLFSLFMLHFCIWKCCLNRECSANGTDTVLNQVLDDYKIYQSSKLESIQSDLIISLFLFLKAQI